MRAAFLVLLIVGCSDPPRSRREPPSHPRATAVDASNPRPPSSSPPQPPGSATQVLGATPPALLAKLEAGIGCRWAENGLPQSCDAATALETHVKEHKTDELLSGCLAALADPRPPVRMMVGTCLYQYHFGTSDLMAEPYSARVFDAVLPAIVRETAQHGRAALANGIWQHSAAHAKRIDGVLETVAKLDRERDGHALGTLLDTLHDAQSSTSEPPKSVVDAALEAAKSPSAWARRSAFELMGAAPGRAADVCPVLAAAAEKGDTWREAVGAVAALDGACASHHGAVTASIVGHLERAGEPKPPREDDVSSVSELLTFVGRDAVAKEHKEKIAKAAEALARAPKLTKWQKEYVVHVAQHARGIEPKKR